MKIIQDAREQIPYAFEHSRYAGVVVEEGSLPTGDYSLQGLENHVAVERKSLDDLIACLSQGRERFERELIRAQGLEAFLVVVEAHFVDLARGEYRSRMDGHAAAQSVLAFMARYRVPFFFAGSRAAAEYATFSFLKQYLQNAQKRLGAIVRAHGDMATQLETV
jgi:ERCC4-type nuclease